MSKDHFYLVWCPTGSSPPRQKHANRWDAQAEAERLARSAPGAEFFVVRAVSRSKKSDVVTDVMVEPEEMEIPF